MYGQFKQRWLTGKVDADGVYGYQCVDLIRQYMHELFGLQRGGAWGNAIDYWTHTNANVLTKFDKISGTDARQGDIVVFHGTSGNPYGHIGLVDSQSGTDIYTLEQNGATGNGSGTGGDAIRLRWIPKSRVAGLLRPKQGVEMTTLTTARILAYHILGRIWPGNNALAGEVDADLNNNHVNRPLEAKIVEFYNSPEGKNWRESALPDLIRRASERDALARQVADLQVALQNEQNKPPREVIKEVEKIVEKPVEVPVEVIKEIEVVKEIKTPLNWTTVKEFLIKEATKLLAKIREKKGQ